MVSARLLAGALLSAAIALCAAAPSLAAQSPLLASPYEYLGWGNPQPPASVIEATGVGDLTMAFVLSKGKCDPEWDGHRPLLGGVDQHAIEAVRAAGGDVVVSFGGWSGKKLGSSCKTPTALAGAYQKVIEAYSLSAIDVDIEHGEMANKKTRMRVAEALLATQRANPGLEISVTMGTAEAGPEKDALSLIADAKAIGFQPTVWTLMPFDFGKPATDMGHASIRAVEGLAADLVAAYGLSTAAAYEHSGISSMNGETDEASETVSQGDFQTMLTFAAAHHLGRMSFWAVNRDRPCQAERAPEEECSGIAQTPFAFTEALAGYHG
ncbi:MAG TPA: chitinase [Solirubrobacteraceae bacterium]|nr:chitinase [Solirubrobacteraceae bacterium]